MTDSIPTATPPAPGRPRRGDKRARLVAAAGALLHRQGVLSTTLADVAQHADIPAGNVYYYFRTKDDLVRAVIDSQVEQVHELLRATAADPDPAARLVALARRWVEMADLVARYGCPFGSLSAELDRRDDGLDREAARPMGAILDWATEQWAALGSPDPRADAVTLLAGIQGAAVLAAAFRDPGLLSAEITRLERWIADR